MALLQNSTILSPVLYLLLLTLLTSAATLSSKETDQLALLDFKQHISNDPNGILGSWNASLNHCHWPGIRCDSRNQRVIALHLATEDLHGALTPSLGNLTFLKSINLGRNKFNGKIPQELGGLIKLRRLNMTGNALGGEIPANLSHCLELVQVDFSDNKLVGNIPTQIFSLKKLASLDLGRNNLSGEIPRAIGNLSSLKYLYLSENHFYGIIPDDIGRLTSLSILALNQNGNLNGTVPLSLYNISTITYLALSDNSFSGNLPSDIGLTMSSLRTLYVGGNQLSGTIPASFGNATNLEDLDLPENLFSGQVPTDLGNIKRLKWLSVGHNLLGSYSTGDLSFIEALSNITTLKNLDFGMNNFGGQLPDSIGNLSLQLQELSLESNQISGEIPGGIENLKNLYSLSMNENLFSGSIPTYFGNFQMMQNLELGGNRLSGQIPFPSLCNSSRLYSLTLYDNRLEGSIHPSIENCQRLGDLRMCHNKLNGTIPSEIFSISSFSKNLNMSHNTFSGPLPADVGKLKNIIELDFSVNNLSGEIPETIVGCSSLQYLDMHGNLFIGTIPPKLDSLKDIQYLDLSQNKITGKIPRDVERIATLQFLNLSFNDLEGEVPMEGVFANASLISITGNSKLCGGIPELLLPRCPSTTGNHQRKPFNFGLLVAFPVSMGLLSFLLLIILCWTRKRRRSSGIVPYMEDQKFPRLSYQELFEATSGFASENLIGSGSYGSVYKGELKKHGGTTVAVKVLDLEKLGASKSFISECKALRNVRHRNLIKLLTCFSGYDYRSNEFSALVYNFMGNGDLEKWIHHPNATTVGSSLQRVLNMVQRLDIAIDVASALHYLHDHCAIPIIHCDLKPGNILLDDNLIAHVADFGLARILAQTVDSPAQPLSSSIGVRGTIGYVAPEYAMGAGISTLGDVYSYGILLLEIFTGRSPADDLFNDGFHIHEYVKAAIPEHVMEIVDPLLFTEEKGDHQVTVENENCKKMNGVDWACFVKILLEQDKMQNCLLSLFKIGLACSLNSPKGRMSMKEVTTKLRLIKQDYLRVEKCSP